MSSENDKSFNLYTPLILTNPINKTQENEDTLIVERLKISKLIKKKYLTDSFFATCDLNNDISKNLNSIKLQTEEINNTTKKEYQLTNQSLYEQKKERKQQNDETLINQNLIQTDIISNTKKLIESYKDKTDELKFNLIETEKKLEEKTLLSRTLEINNHELKNSINRYIAHTKKLDAKLVMLNELELNINQIEELDNKVKFFQEENVRLSGEITIIEKKYETIKENFTKEQFEKNNIYKQIQELNDSLMQNNIVDTNYIKIINEENSVDSNLSNDISENNLKENSKTFEPIKTLDGDIEHIVENKCLPIPHS